MRYAVHGIRFTAGRKAQGIGSKLKGFSPLRGGLRWGLKIFFQEHLRSSSQGVKNNE
jgi:hypothetical protein